MKIDELYRHELHDASDIKQHLPLLAELASKCESVTEFGVRDGRSTVALIYGHPKVVLSYDINPTPFEKQLTEAAGEAGVGFAFYQADDLQIEIEQTDMLFIDTYHTYGQLIQELKKHSQKVNRFIVMHDTSTFGYKGEDGGEGLWPAIQDFLHENEAAWKLLFRHSHCNGLTVLERVV